jgi:enoyl-CoA hydratase
LELAMSCHIRLVSETAKLGLPELSLGLIPGFAGTQRLTRYVGTQKAAEMLLTGEPISGTEAVQAGLALKAVSDDELYNETIKLAHKIENKSSASIKAVITLLNYATKEQFDVGVEHEAKLFSELFETNDAKEGIAAFIEKRKPNFTGK